MNDAEPPGKPSWRDVGVVLGVAAAIFGFVATFVQVQTELPKLWNMAKAVLVIGLGAVGYLWRGPLLKSYPAYRRNRIAAIFITSLAALLALMLVAGTAVLPSPPEAHQLLVIRPSSSQQLFDDFSGGLDRVNKWQLAINDSGDPVALKQVYVQDGKLYFDVAGRAANFTLSPRLPRRPIRRLTMTMSLVSQTGGSSGAAYLIVESAQGREHRVWLGPDENARPASGYYICPSGTCKEKHGANLKGQTGIPKNVPLDVTAEVTNTDQVRLSIDGYSDAPAPVEQDPLTGFRFYLFSDPAKFVVSIDDIRVTYAA